MSKLRVAINGFGRIGRLTFRKLYQNTEVEIVAINDLTDPESLAHLLSYDSVHGRMPQGVKASYNAIMLDGQEIPILAEKDPASLPWNNMKVDVVLECTGRFRKKEEAGKHLQAGAKKVLISAPAKGGDVKTIVLGINENSITEEDHILSNASCTTNCLAPMVKVLDDLAGISSGMLVTVHAYTADQNLVDAPHKDLRRARAAAVNIVPTTTGAASATELVLPHLKGKLDGLAYRVPVPNGSVSDFTAVVEKAVSAEEINAAYQQAAQGSFKGIIEYTEAPLVSSDIVGNGHSCVFDSKMTTVMGKTVKVVGWYDNEAGYSARMADLVELLRKKYF